MGSGSQSLEDLAAGLARWDGKSRAPVAALYESYRATPGFAAALVSLAAEDATSEGATWVLKTWLEAGGDLGSALVSPLLAAAAGSERWVTRLHILQLLPLLSLDASHRALLEPWVREGLESGNRFVRAWALDAFWELARRSPDLQDEAARRLDEAEAAEAASVQARIRAIRKRPF